MSCEATRRKQEEHVRRQACYHSINLEQTTCKHDEHHIINIQVCVCVYLIMHVDTNQD